MNQRQSKFKSFGLYIHVPFCAVRCGYCDFNTYTPGELAEENAIDIWTSALINEISYSLAALPEYEAIDTIFFGGGTPSLVPLGNLEKIFTKINTSFKISQNVEITLEANPDTLDAAKIKDWKDLGINRVSLGVQSSDQKVLKILDRTHKPENVKNSIALLREANLNNFSLDLIYGTPGETLDSWKKSVEYLLEYDPVHISAYSLTVEPGTALYRKVKNKEIQNINQDDQADKYLLADKLFEKHDLSWYEISNWSKPGYQCKHNLLYWRNQNWWGYGPGAHSHIDGKRWWNVKHPAKYAAKLQSEKSAIEDYEILDLNQKQLEAVMLQIRLKESNLREFISEEILNDWSHRGYVVSQANNWQLTPQGRLMLDSLVGQITS